MYEFEELTGAENDAVYTNSDNCGPYNGECYPIMEDCCGPDCSPDCSPSEPCGPEYDDD